MQRPVIRNLQVVAVLIALGVAFAPGAGAVNTVRVRPLVQRRVVNTVRPQKRGPPLGPRHVFGTILAIDSTGNILSVKRRNGKMITVDATTCIANGDYSYPLFIGKTVGIDGTFGTTTATFTAVHVEALPSLTSLESDSPS